MKIEVDVQVWVGWREFGYGQRSILGIFESESLAREAGADTVQQFTVNEAD